MAFPKFTSNMSKHIGDSRSACPMLNALANHGILPHDGRNITFKELNVKVRQSFNFAPSFCFFVPRFAAGFLNRDYFTDKFDLHELNLHADNAIEHDARWAVFLVQYLSSCLANKIISVSQDKTWRSFRIRGRQISNSLMIY